MAKTRWYIWYCITPIVLSNPDFMIVKYVMSLIFINFLPVSGCLMEFVLTIATVLHFMLLRLAEFCLEFTINSNIILKI